jgi:2-iminoacetate synthase
MFSDRYEMVWEQVLELPFSAAIDIDLLRPRVASDFAHILWRQGLGSGKELDEVLTRRAAETKRELYGRHVFVIAPIYVTSICQEQCLYCNFRAGNKGVGVERRRLTDEELEKEATYLIEEKGLKVLELVYSADPQMRVDAMCRHVELLQRVLARHGGGYVGLSAEALDESEYRRLVSAGLGWSVLWQETYDESRYKVLHPGKTKKTNFRYRLDAYERMLEAGIEHVGIGILSGLSDWKRDWATLMLHEEYLQRHYENGATILGTPRLKTAPGAALHESEFVPTRQEFVAAIALHNLFSPRTLPFVSTRENWDVCIELAQGGGCLFTLNCSTTPGGYSLKHGGCQFSSNSYDAPVYAEQLKSEGIEPVFNWKAADLRGRYAPGEPRAESAQAMVAI